MHAMTEIVQRIITSLRIHAASKLDLCEGGSFSTAIFISDIQLSVFSFSSFIYSVCPFVAFLKRQRMPKMRTLLCLVDIKMRSLCNLLCVMIRLSECEVLAVITDNSVSLPS